MKSGPRIALAVAAGYALGRSRKMKLAIMVGGMLTARRLGTDPKELLEQGTRYVASSPEMKKLTGEVRERLLEAARTAAVSAASSRIDSFGENLSKRAADLRVPRSGEGAAEASAGEGRSADAETASEEGEERATESAPRAGTGTGGGSESSGTAETGSSRTTSRAGSQPGSGPRSRASPHEERRIAFEQGW